MIGFNLITGFLGSGKTTLLSNLLSELSGDNRIAIIQNEFAPSGIDGKILKQNHDQFKLVEINNGSVFCVCQLSNFVQNMMKLIDEYQPDMIFLEASGLADPISIVELLQCDSLKELVSLDQIYTLVDACNYFKGLNTLVRFKHQIMVADHIIINKTDMCYHELDRITESVRKLNPYANIIPTMYARIDWEFHTSINKEKTSAAKQFRGIESEGRPNIQACVLRTHEKLSENQFKSFIEDLKKQCLRIKGFINLNDDRVVSINTTFNNTEYNVLNTYSGPSELIAFAYNLSIIELQKLFKKHQYNQSN